MNGKPDLKIDWCTYEAAKFACENWHYSKTMPVGKIFKIGIWENNIFIGCVLFSRGANNNMLKSYNLKVNEGCELTRIALSKHSNSVTTIVSQAISILKHKNNGLRLIVSYADKDQSHLDIIYQAGNWIYVGSSMNNKPDGSWILNGKRKHGKSISDLIVRKGGLKGNTREKYIRKYIDKNAIKYITKGKHKYLMPLDKKMRRQIIKLSKPYPKKICPKGVTGSTSGFQPEGIGPSPISGLGVKR